MVAEKPFGITKTGARIVSTITMSCHEVTKNLSEPLMCMYYLNTLSTQTPSRAFRALVTSGGKSIRLDIRYTEAYGPHEIRLNKDGTNIYTKTMITCDKDLASQIYVGREELKVRSIGHCVMLEEAVKHLRTEGDVRT